MQATYDAVIIGAGPNGLAAAITLAQAGRAVAVFEAQDAPGGGVRTKELTLPGFLHDVCSAIHPYRLSSTAWNGSIRQYHWHIPSMMGLRRCLSVL
jgi:phytoene dehydrogenase-like protein